MTVVSRIRVQPYAITAEGNYTNWMGADEKHTVPVGETKYCDDTTGGWTSVNPFVSQRAWHMPAFLNGTLFNPEGSELARFTNYPPDWYTGYTPTPLSHYPDPNTAEINEAAWQTLAKSNPSVPELGLYQAIGELKDLPSLIQGYGRSLLRSAAAGYLSWRWCIKPMMSDLEKLWNFQKYANKRLEELKKLQSGRSMRRRVQLLQDRWASPSTDTYIQSMGATIRAKVRTIYTRHRWATVHWKVKTDSPLCGMADEDLIRYARRTMLGVNSRGALSAAWELMPWSWMVDWFSNVGTMIDATNNSIGLEYSRMALMQETTSATFVNVYDKPGWVTLDGTFDLNYRRKWRMPFLPVVPFPLPSLPIFSNGKLSILAALAILRR